MTVTNIPGGGSLTALAVGGIMPNSVTKYGG
jgi:hypothetical protein